MSKITLEKVLEDRAVITNKIVPLAAATLAVTKALHEGNIISVSKADGSTLTLPNASGGGDQYNVFVNTTITSVGLIVKVANASDTMVGGATVWSDNAADAVTHFKAGGTDDTITLNGTTSGGYAGMMVKLIDIGLNLWFVEIIGKATGVEITPFSATV